MNTAPPAVTKKDLSALITTSLSRKKPIRRQEQMPVISQKTYIRIMLAENTRPIMAPKNKTTIRKYSC